MNVDFNNIRKQACYSYHRLTKKLNNHIDDGEITIEVDEIQGEMDELRQLIMTMAWCKVEGHDFFDYVGEEVGDVEWFNPEEEQCH